jgi:hypothetical protein
LGGLPVRVTLFYISGQSGKNRQAIFRQGQPPIWVRIEEVEAENCDLAMDFARPLPGEIFLNSLALN